MQDCRNSDYDEHVNAAHVAHDGHVISPDGRRVCCWCLSFSQETPPDRVHDVHKVRQKSCLNMHLFMALLL